MKKISSVQLITLLICSKLFYIMTYVPDKGQNGMAFIITSIITTVIQGIMVIPAVAFYNKNNGEGIFTFAESKSRVLGICVCLVYLTDSLFAIITAMGNLSFFLQFCFSDTYAPWAIIIILCATCFYISKMGISALARTTGIVVVITLISLALVMSGFNHYNGLAGLNMAIKNPISKILSGIPRTIANSHELVAYVILLSALRNKPAKTAYGYLCIKVLITITAVLSVVLVLGDFATISKLPFFSLSAFSQTKIIEHYEAFFMLIWTLCAIIKITLFTLCAQICVKQIFPKLSSSITIGIPLIIPAIITIPVLMKWKWEEISLDHVKLILVIVSVVVIPLILLMFKKRKPQ